MLRDELKEIEKRFEEVRIVSLESKIKEHLIELPQILRDLVKLGEKSYNYTYLYEEKNSVAIERCQKLIVDFAESNGLQVVFNTYYSLIYRGSHQEGVEHYRFVLTWD